MRAASGPAKPTPAAGPKRVLILDSFGREVAPFAAVASAFRTTLAEELGETVDFYDVPLDMARFAEPEKEGPFVEFLKARFADRPLDMVVPIGALAGRFAAQYRDRLFPGTPMVFTGVDPRLVPPDLTRTNATLVTQKINLPGLVEDILQMQPDTTNIAVVFGASRLEKFWAGECRREFQPFTDRVGFTWLNDLSLAQVLERSAALPPHSFILFVMFVMDAAGVPFDGDEALRRLRAVANAPVFGYFGSQFGLGTVGGHLYQDSEVGMRAARAAIRVLRGERPESIPPEILEAPAPVYDWRELQRWGISETRLPAGSVIRFRRPTFWELYRWRVVGVVLFCFLQTGLIVALLINRAKRRRGEAVATLTADLSTKFINLPPGEVDHEIEDAQRRVCECLGLDLCALWQWSAETPRILKLTHLSRPIDPPPPEPMYAHEYFPWCQELLEAGRIIVVPSMDELPPEAARDKEAWRQFGVKTTLTFPLSFGGGQVLGALSFNTMRAERSWPQEIVERLQVVAEIFANALARKQADQALRESEGRLSLAADSAGAGLWSLDLASGSLWLTEKARELFHLRRDQPLTLDLFLALVHAEDQPAIRQIVQELVHLKREGIVEYRVLEADGAVRWMVSRGRVQCSATGEPTHLMGVTVDITERKRAEQALRDFSARLIRTQEAERSRLARELHDDITQRLARLAIDVGRSDSGISVQSPDETARSMREELIRLSDDVHALSYRLHPSILDDLGLAAAVKAEAERFEQQGSSPIEVEVQDIPEPVSPDVALCVFRVTQEALRNAARHAGARAMKLSLRGSDGGLQLAVQDDGCGFDPALQRDRPSLGLASMRERVHLLGGELDIESAPGHGTTILAWVPLKEEP